MRFLLLICVEGPSADQSADNSPASSAMAEEIPDINTWLAETGTQRMLGSPLTGPQDAVTVRHRHGETIVTDGPYAETKEFIAGFDLIDCENIEAAINIASRHPVAYHGMVEIRQLIDFL
jgi:hypothetical protein